MSSGALTAKLLTSGEGLLLDLIEEGKDSVGKESEYGSPIEFMFAVAAWVFIRARLPEGEFLSTFRLSDKEARAQSEINDHRWVCVVPQVVVAQYRADFVIYHPKGLVGLSGIIVECDGHDFHERTKEQAVRDKSRDRDLQEAGFKVMRFAGSEVWADAFECASQAIALARDISIDTMHARHLMAKGETDEAIKLLKHWP